MTYVGSRHTRVEDEALLRGEGRFIDDIHLPGMLECAFVRSTVAHARLRAVDMEAARHAPGVIAVLGLNELLPHLASERLPLGFALETIEGEVTPFVLAKEEVCFVGEAIAVVVAENRYLAEDAAALVNIDMDILPAVSDAANALVDAPLVHTEKESNRLKEIKQCYGDTDEAFKRAAHVCSLSLRQERGAAHPIEGRGIVAHYDSPGDQLNVWSSTQMPHEVRALLAKTLGIDEERIRVVVPDVGGGFGAKFLMYPEEAVLACATRLLDRPLKWIEDRREHFLSAIQARTQFWNVEMAIDKNGKILGVRGHVTHDQGAYTPQGFNLPYNASVAMPGPYVVPAYDLTVDVVETNRPPTIPVRGAGYPEATFAMERLLDVAARDSGLDRAEIRRLNLISVEQMPYEKPLKTRSGSTVKYDSGDYQTCQTMALEMIGYHQFRHRQQTAKEQGQYLGIGIANGIKGTGRGPFESAVVRVGRSGDVTVYTGATAMGQGLKTVFTQIAADALGSRPSSIRIVAGDTGTISLGQGGFASRQTVTAGSAVHLAAVNIRKKALHVASHLLEVPEEDLSITDGRIYITDSPSDSVTLAELAEALAGAPGYALPADVEPGLEAQIHFSPPDLVYSNTTHAVEVEVSPNTGVTTIHRYVVANDCGRMINPTLVEGQIHGGVVHGIGNALFEQMIFDENAQPLTTNFGDYLLPTITEVPYIEITHMESPSPLNPLGVKGVGESGVVPAAAVIVSAIEDALSPWGIRINEYPVTPMLVVDLITSAEKARESIG